MLKDMLVSLHNSIQAYIASLIHQFKEEMCEIGTKVSCTEYRICEFATTFNELVDAHNERDEYIEWLMVKIVNLEDHSRQNNVKMNGITETVHSTNLRDYFTKLPFFWTHPLLN